MIGEYQKIRHVPRSITLRRTITKALTGCAFVVPLVHPSSAGANVIYQWVTASVTNFDPVACGTATCQNNVLAQLAATDTTLNDGSEQITVTDTIAAGGTTSGSAPGGCTTCNLPSGIVSLPDYGVGQSSLNLNFATAPFLSGSVTITGKIFGYSVKGTGSNWAGYFDGEASFFSQDCFTPGSNTGCHVTGYWVTTSSAVGSVPSTTTPEPSSAALIAAALAGLAYAKTRLRQRSRPPHISERDRAVKTYS
jgi:hypothetical protein